MSQEDYATYLEKKEVVKFYVVRKHANGKWTCSIGGGGDGREILADGYFDTAEEAVRDAERIPIGLNRLLNRPSPIRFRKDEWVEECDHCGLYGLGHGRK